MLEGTNAQPSSFFSAPTTADNDDDDFERMLQAGNSEGQTTISLDDDDDLEKIVKSAGASTFVPAVPAGSISLDDDDDDDLERIVQKANKQANASGSRENSSTSLQIKSQVQAQNKPQIGTP
jgi:hypothetical protein